MASCGLSDKKSTLRRNLLPPSSEQKSKSPGGWGCRYGREMARADSERMEAVKNKWATLCSVSYVKVFLRGIFFALKMEAAGFFEMSVRVLETTGR